MKNHAKNTYAALLAAMVLLGGLTACGDSSSVDTAESTAESESIAEDTSSDDADESVESDAEDADSKTNEKDSSSAKDKDAKDSKASKDSKDAKDSKDSKDAKDSKSKDSDSSKADSSSSKSADENGKKNDSASSKTESHSGGDSAKTTTAKPADNKKTTTTTTVNDEDDDDPEDVEKPTKYIYLNDTTAQYSGDGIVVNGSTITIGKGGTYEITGTLSNGQIVINTDKKKVKLHLNGASITNHAGSAIFCQNAKKLTINSLAGSVNYLEDGGVHDEDKGTVFSEDTIQIKGEGELNIKANYAHGIQSDDDIVVNGGTLNIEAAKSCLHSNDGIEINGGVNYCFGGTNGIKTDGYINITGGSSVFIGGVREEKGAIYCDGSLSVTGGSFWAIGNTCTMPDAAATTANVIGLMFANSQPAGTLVNVTSGGNGIFTMSSPNNFRYVIYSGPELLLNAEYNVNYGGSTDGSGDHYVYFGGSYTDGTDGGNFTAGNPVTIYKIQ